jgi:hypothetical protein
LSPRQPAGGKSGANKLHKTKIMEYHKNSVFGVLIDSFLREVREVEIDADQKGDYWESLCRLIGCDPRGACIRHQAFGPVEGLWMKLQVDREGLFKRGNPVFKFDAGEGWFAGRGLVVGSDELGHEVDTKLSVEDVQKMVTWTDLTVDVMDEGGMRLPCLIEKEREFQPDEDLEFNIYVAVDRRAKP